LQHFQKMFVTFCAIFAKTRQLAQFKNFNNFVSRSMTLPKCQCVMTPLTGVQTAVWYINICCFISDFRPVVNFNYVFVSWT